MVSTHASLSSSDPSPFHFYTCWLLVNDGVGIITVRLSLCTSELIKIMIFFDILFDISMIFLFLLVHDGAGTIAVRFSLCTCMMIKNMIISFIFLIFL